MDEERIPGLPSGDGNEPDLQPAVVERLVRGDRPIDAHVQSIGATGLDVGNFALDTDRDKLDRVGMQPVVVQ